MAAPAVSAALVVVEVRGGNIVSISANSENVRVVIWDWDNAAALDGATIEACVTKYHPDDTADPDNGALPLSNLPPSIQAYLERTEPAENPYRALLAEYDAWATQREDLNDREAACDFPAPSAWEASDDDARDLCNRMGEALRAFLVGNALREFAGLPPLGESTETAPPAASPEANNPWGEPGLEGIEVEGDD